MINEVAECQHMIVLLSTVGSKTYALLHNALSPNLSKMKPITDLLKQHFDAKPLAIVE